MEASLAFFLRSIQKAIESNKGQPAFKARHEIAAYIQRARVHNLH